MIRVSTYTSHPGAESVAEAEITTIRVEIVIDHDQVVLSSGASYKMDDEGVHEAAKAAISVLRNRLIQAEKELKAMGLLPKDYVR